jgi:hypothetical protein
LQNHQRQRGDKKEETGDYDQHGVNNCISFIAMTLWLFAFGTITDMTFRRHTSMGRKSIFWFDALLVVSCASSPDPISDSVTRGMSAVVTLTPFQPQPDALVNPALKPNTPQVEPTYTPYPTKYVVSENLPTPVLVIPMPGGAIPDFNLLNTNNPSSACLSVTTPLQRRPMVIKVANSPDYVRPQSGLTLADVVYEYYIEWGDTRFIAVMYGNDSPMVGPVRSGRYFDEHVARMYHAFLVFTGADPRELSYLENSTLNDFLVIAYSNNTICPPVVLGPGRRDSYNNAFFNTAKWAACAAKKGVDNSRQTCVAVSLPGTLRKGCLPHAFSFFN